MEQEITKMSNILTDEGHKIVYRDTDSIFIVTPYPKRKQSKKIKKIKKIRK